MAPVPVKVKLLKEMYHVDLDVDEPVLKFRQAIEEVTYIPPGEFFGKNSGNFFRKIFRKIFSEKIYC